MSKISFIQSNDRKYNVTRALSLIKSEIIHGLKNAKNIVVKPNCVVTDYQLASTHVDVLEAVFGFIAPYAKNQIVLAEGSGIGETVDAFKNYNYFSIQEKYGFAFIDLNRDEFKTVDLIDRHGKKWGAQVSRTILDADYLISVAVPKTHNEVVYTGAIKNIAVGSLLRPEGSFAARIASRFGIVRNNKAMIHQGYHILNQNIYTLAKKINISLAVIDGYEAMQGDGPGHGGELVPAHWAMASSDALSVDLTALKLMGIDSKNVGYLSLLENDLKTDEPFIIGDNWRESVKKFKMHTNFEKMKKWQ
jgi:uncharacterized protein (DUF362 family)